MPRIRVFPYIQGSRSAKALAEVLEGKVLKLEGSKYRPGRGDVVINWGSGNFRNFQPARTLNPDVRVAQCKLSTFQRLSADEVSIPRFWTDKGAIPADAFPIVCRRKLRGQGGDGIVIANDAGELVNAPLYTEYKKKKDEFRVHVVGDEAFFIQRKARKLDHENPNWQIRNLAGGFAFVEIAQDDTPRMVVDQALKAVKSLALDFGGVDVIWNEAEEKAYVLEVNTACGLEERTADHYRQALLHYIEV